MGYVRKYEWQLIILLLVCAYRDCLYCSAKKLHEPNGQIKQHRVKASKRNIDYGINHPWHGNDLHHRNHKKNETSSNGVNDGPQNHRRIERDHVGAYLNEGTLTSLMKSTTQSDFESDDGRDSIYKPIRIRALLVRHPSSGYHMLSSIQRQTIMDMIQPGLNNWSKALSVPRIRGNLTIDKDQLYDGMSCGPGIDSGEPSVLIPEDHFTIGETNTDLVVYVSVSVQEDVWEKIIQNQNSPQEGPSTDATKSTQSPPTPVVAENNSYTDKWVDFTNYTGPSIFFRTEEPLLENSTSSLNNSTLQQPTKIPPAYCSGSYLASATYCSTDQFDRPIAGLLHLCIGRDFFKPTSRDLNHLSIMHELGHILGFNSHSLAYFRDKETGVPLTQRVDGDIPDVEVECTGVELGRGNATIPLPSKEILQFREVRGVRVSEIVTPAVKQIVRNRFNCEEINGAELESEIYHPVNETTGNCIGDHWERRLFKYDIMNPIIDITMPSSLFSPLTLAYFLDSGWYNVNASRAYSSNIWGRGAGCNFVNNPCLSKDGRVPSKNTKFFCNSRDGHNYDGCTSDMRSKAICSMTEFDSDLPAEFQYFFEKKNFGGYDMSLDFCPTFVGTSEGICTVKAGTEVQKTRLDSFGFANSRCLSGKSSGKDGPLCVQVACALESKSLHVKLDGFWEQCHYKGEVIKSWWDNDYVVCPDPLLLCPTFHCPRDCLHDGYVSKCNFHDDSCSCPLNATMKIMTETNLTIPCRNETIDISEHYLLRDYYVINSNALEDDQKNILDHAARMFIQMSVGEVISFVACSLLVVVSCTILLIYVVKVLRQRAEFLSFFPKWFPRSNAWRVDLTQWTLSQRQGESENDKDKMVASVLHNLRVDNATMGIVSELNEHINVLNEDGLDEDVSNENTMNSSPTNNLTVHIQERTILRSQLPPLPGVGRILLIPGFNYIDDSMLISNDDDLLTAADATAIGSRTSCRTSQLESCSVQSVIDDEDLVESNTVRRRR